MAVRAAGAVPAAGGRRGGGGGLLYSPIEGCTVTVKNQVYTGQALKPNPVVKDDGARLKKDTDYTVSYKKNTDIGTATVVIKGKGTYTGTVKATFKINPKAMAIKTLTAGRKKLPVRRKKGAASPATRCSTASGRISPPRPPWPSKRPRPPRRPSRI